MQTERPDLPAMSMDGDTAPPRQNGELVFGAPWESRAFGMAVALHAAGMYGWNEFSAQLGQEFAEHAGEHVHDRVLPPAPEAESDYYAHWLASLEDVLLRKGVLSEAELDARTAQFASGEFDHHDELAQ